MKTFCKDYWELCKENGRFYKKHWKGVVLINAAIIAAQFGYLYYQGKKFEKSLKDIDAKDEAHY